jgi:hypothetical protein
MKAATDVPGGSSGSSKSRHRFSAIWAIGASAAAIIVALALLYMWAVVLEGTGSGPGVLGGIAFTAGVALFGLVLLLLGRWSSVGALLVALVLGAALGAAAG